MFDLDGPGWSCRAVPVILPTKGWFLRTGGVLLVNVEMVHFLHTLPDERERGKESMGFGARKGDHVLDCSKTALN